MEKWPAPRWLVEMLGATLAVSNYSHEALAQSGAAGSPRTISDITAILDQQKPDTAKAGQTRAQADAQPPDSKDRSALSTFYFQRAVARASLGRNREAIADGEKAVELGTNFFTETSRYQEFVINQYLIVGETKRGIEETERLSRKYEELGRGKGRFFSGNVRIVSAYVAIGDLKQAEVYVKRSQA